MNRKTICAFNLLAALLFAQVALAQGDSRSIEYGAGIGKIRLGMEDVQVEQLLGKPTTSSAAMGLEIESWASSRSSRRPEQTFVVFRHDKKGHKWQAAEIIVTSPFFKTKAGVSTQSSLDAIWREFPDLHHTGSGDGADGSRLDLYDSEGTGIAFLIEPTGAPKTGAPAGSWGKCRAILVHDVRNEATFVPIGTPAKAVERV